MNKQNYVWVIEILIYSSWNHYGLCENTREQGIRIWRMCQDDLPNEKFRLRKYLPQED